MKSTVKIEPKSRFSFDLKEIFEYRELLFYFAWKDIKVKYKQAFLGVLWTVLQPLILITIFVVFLARGLKAPTDNVPAPIFYFSGLLLWNLFSSSVTSSANSMVANASIIKKIFFPRLVIPISSILVSSFDFLIASGLFLALVMYYLNSGIDIHLVSLIPAIMLGYGITVMTALGLGSMIAAWNVKYRDFRYVVPFLVQALFFLTPVIYPVKMVSNYTWGSKIFALNPISSAIDVTRKAILGQEIWSIELMISSVTAVILFLLGIIIFKRSEAYFADIV